MQAGQPHWYCPSRDGCPEPPSHGSPDSATPVWTPESCIPGVQPQQPNHNGYKRTDAPACDTQSSEINILSELLAYIMDGGRCTDHPTGKPQPISRSQSTVRVGVHTRDCCAHADQ